MPDSNNSGPPEVWWAESIVSANGRGGLVKFTIGQATKVVTPEEARAFAQSIYEAAEASEIDEVLVAWLTDTGGLNLPLPPALALLREFRELRRRRNADA